MQRAHTLFARRRLAVIRVRVFLQQDALADFEQHVDAQRAGCGRVKNKFLDGHAVAPGGQFVLRERQLRPHDIAVAQRLQLPPVEGEMHPIGRADLPLPVHDVQRAGRGQLFSGFLDARNFGPFFFLQLFCRFDFRRFIFDGFNQRADLAGDHQRDDADERDGRHFDAAEQGDGAPVLHDLDAPDQDADRPEDVVNRAGLF